MTDKDKECKNTAGFTKHSGLAKYSRSGNAGPAKQSGSGNAQRIRLFSRTRCVYLLMCISFCVSPDPDSVSRHPDPCRPDT